MKTVFFQGVKEMNGAAVFCFVQVIRREAAKGGRKG